MTTLSKEEINRLEIKIEAVEKLSSAEFKVIIANRCWFGIRRKAINLFKKYSLDKTKDSNAVLFLILEKDQQISIYGDEGIHQKVGTNHWELICDQVTAKLKQNEYADAIALGIHLIADSLKEHFPAHEDNVNEVSNEIIFE